MAEVTVEAHVEASTDVMYDLVADVTRMGDWSPETTSCRWVGTWEGPQVGARFRGSNRKGWRRWTTTCTVASADPGRLFAFDVAYGPIPIARWTYEFVAEGSGCRVKETWVDHRPAWMLRAEPFVMGITDRPQHNRDQMQRTLENLRRHAEGRAN